MDIKGAQWWWWIWWGSLLATSQGLGRCRFLLNVVMNSTSEQVDHIESTGGESSGVLIMTIWKLTMLDVMIKMLGSGSNDDGLQI